MKRPYARRTEVSAPKHLWSGDWRQESEEAAARLTRRRAQTGARAEEPPQPAAAGPSAWARMVARVRAARARAAQRTRASARRPRTRSAAWRLRARPRRDRRMPRGALTIVLGTLAGAAVGYGVVSLLTDDSSARGSSRPVAAARAPGWLGAQTMSVPIGGAGTLLGSGGSGAMIALIVPGSPADQAGLVPGELITSLNGRRISSSADLASALAHLHPGDQVQIGYQEGPLSGSARATLTAQPPGSP